MKQNYLIVRISRMFLALLGFGGVVAACSEPVCEYGTPHGEWTISGKVMDADSKPIDGIQVSGPTSFYNDSSVKTKSDGSFTITGTSVDASSVLLVFTDIDGEANGSFKSANKDIATTQISKGNKKDHWDTGTYEARNVQIKLEKQDN